jgi:hydrogenase maturation protease
LNKSDKILVIGIGNEFRGDDVAGLLCADKLREKKFENATIRCCNRDGSALLLLWERYDNVVLIDAVSSGAAAGTIHEIDLHNNEIEEESFRASGHSFGIFETVKLAGYIGRVPSQLKLYGIEGVRYSMGDEPSAEVIKSVDIVVDRVSEYLEA